MLRQLGTRVPIPGGAVRHVRCLLGLHGHGNTASCFGISPDSTPVSKRPWIMAHERNHVAASASASPVPPSGPMSIVAAQQLGLQLPDSCCGCGIRLQQTDPDAPGYFIVPAKLISMMERQAAGGSAAGDAEPEAAGPATAPGAADDDVDDYESSRRELDAELSSRLAKKRASSPSQNAEDEEDGRPDVLCQRCYSLRNSGKVAVQAVEGQLPQFDLAKKVGRKIFLQKDRRAVVLCVVDVWDFHGSLPLLALRSLYPPGTGEQAPEDLKFKLMVAVNKCDLLPKQATFARINQWVRMRLKQAGIPRPEKVFLVSAADGTGVRQMVEDVKAELGFRGDLWVVGAQNAGKSSLISKMKKFGGTAGKREPTISHMPGTTLGLLNVPGLPLGPKHRAFDTPGVPHDYQLTSHLQLEDVKAVLPRKELKPRTFRIASGNTLLLGGLARLDVVAAPSSSIYLTVFVSHFVNLHMGKTEKAEECLTKHVGTMLTPPYTQELQRFEPVEVSVEGQSWDQSSKDIAIAGLGWISVGCRGRADFTVWTLPQVSVTTCDALVLDYAREFERPGFSSLLPKTARGKVQVAGKAPGS